jgi:hypothetical protein
MAVEHSWIVESLGGGVGHARCLCGVDFGIARAGDRSSFDRHMEQVEREARTDAGLPPVDRDGIVTVGRLRAELDRLGLPDDTLVSLDVNLGADEAVRSVWVQASDAVPSDAGTDPTGEGTVSVLMISNEAGPV